MTQHSPRSHLTPILEHSQHTTLPAKPPSSKRRPAAVRTLHSSQAFHRIDEAWSSPDRFCQAARRGFRGRRGFRELQNFRSFRGRRGLIEPQAMSEIQTNRRGTHHGQATCGNSQLPAQSLRKSQMPVVALKRDNLRPAKKRNESPGPHNGSLLCLNR